MKRYLFGMIVVVLCYAGCAMVQKPSENLKLICRIDCSQNFSADRYFQHGDVHVVDSPIGKYREAEAKPLSRFGYRFPIEKVGTPHLIVVRYPDDKRREMCMMEGTCYDMTEGVFTDFNQPLTNQMQEIRRVYWPRWTDCSIVFMTWGEGEPAAVAEIEVYQMLDLPTVNMPAPAGTTPRRSIGFEFEDPGGRGMSMGAMSPQQWQDRMIQYMRYTGQNILVYPLVWYHGPHYPSDIEPSQEASSVVAPDRKIYGMSTLEPADWVSPLLKAFEHEQLQFKMAMTLMRLGSLMKDMNIDLASIQAGKETYNNMRADDKVQDGTQDWTVPYNFRNPNLDIFSGQKEWYYGERTGTCSKGPMFNPLHPKVRQAILNLVREIAQKYGTSPAFHGIAMNMWHATLGWFATPKIGYDDYTIRLFTQETGIGIPVDAKASDRFSKRYEFLMANHRDRWLTWRCEKIAELFRTIRDTLVNVRTDLELTISLWSETTMSQLLGNPDGPEYQIFARKSTYDIYRDGGFDIRLLENEPGILIDYVYTPARDRDCWTTKGVNLKLEQMCMFNDHDFLDDITMSTIRAARQPTAFIFDSWMEAWGEFTGFPCEPGDPRVDEFARLWSVPKERISHSNSKYPKDGFWWDWQFRITPPYPSGVHYLEHYAQAVAELDALQITRGGLFAHTGHSHLILPFAKAFRTLPAKKFETVGTSTDPVAVRTLICDNHRYLYLVNREYYPVKINLTLNGGSVKAVELADNQTVKAPSNWPVTLGPYQLRSFLLPSETSVNQFSVTVPQAISDDLTQSAKTALDSIARLQNAEKTLPTGTQQMIILIKNSLEMKKYALLRHLLNSYPIRKCNQMTQEESL